MNNKKGNKTDNNRPELCDNQLIIGFKKGFTSTEQDAEKSILYSRTSTYNLNFTSGEKSPINIYILRKKETFDSNIRLEQQIKRRSVEKEMDVSGSCALNQSSTATNQHDLRNHVYLTSSSNQRIRLQRTMMKYDPQTVLKNKGVFFTSVDRKKTLQPSSTDAINHLPVRTSSHIEYPSPRIKEFNMATDHQRMTRFDHLPSEKIKRPRGNFKLESKMFFTHIYCYC